MDRTKAIHDLKAVKEFFEEEWGAYPECIEDAIKVLENYIDDDDFCKMRGETE